jgi:very-short-patch-repair endonuclease
VADEVVSAPVLPHVTVPRNRKLADPDVVRHWADLPPSDIEGGVTTPLRTVVDCARSMPFPDALAVADSALRRGLVWPPELRARAESTRGAGRAAVQRIAQHATEKAANPFESALRGIAVEAGVLGLEPQVVLECGDGRVRPDLLHRRLRLVAEADSFEWHGRRRALEGDCRRYDDLVAEGWTVLRFAWEQVMFDRPWVSRTLRTTAARCAVTADVQRSFVPAA